MTNSTSREVFINEAHEAALRINRTDTGTIITTFLDKDHEAAIEYAQQIGGRITTPFNQYGGYAVRLDNAEGASVPVWNHIDLPEGTTLRRRDSIRPGDVIVSSHFGTRTVANAKTRGTGPGTTTITCVGIEHAPEAYPADSLIPVVSRATVAVFGPRQQETAAGSLRDLQRDVDYVSEAITAGDLTEALRHLNTLLRDGARLRDMAAREVRKADRENGPPG